jgi:F-type H+-transporting ATPase subunit delta
MASSNLVLQRYATALHELATAAGTVERVEADLLALSARIAADPATGRKLASPRLTREAKRELLKSLLSAGGNDLVRRTVMLLTDKGRAAAVPELAAVFTRVSMTAAGRAQGLVHTPAPLDAATKTSLEQKLGALTGQTVTLQESVEPELVAGLRVVVGSRMIDGTVKTRLERMRAALLAAPLPAFDGKDLD